MFELERRYEPLWPTTRAHDWCGDFELAQQPIEPVY